MTVETTYVHPVNGRPLDDLLPAGGGALRRVVSPALPPRATAAEARADLDVWIRRHEGA